MTQSGDIALLNVTKRFGTTVAVDNINLRLPHGSYCCLLGPSGCGKTTILRLIAGHGRQRQAMSASVVSVWWVCRQCSAARP